MKPRGLLRFFVLAFMSVSSLAEGAQQVVKDTAYEIKLPPGWTRTETRPQGMDVGFRKNTSDGGVATFYFHHEVMPLEVGEGPSSTSDMRKQWDTMVRNQYPGARSVAGAPPKVKGRILINADYELTDHGKRVRRRYTYFLAGRTAFVVQATASPSQWATEAADFDSILASLQPGSALADRGAKSDDAATAELRHTLPTLLGSFPRRWTTSLSDLTLTSSSSEQKRTLVIVLSFARADIGEVYNATKMVFAMIRAGDGDSDLNRLPPTTRRAARNGVEFVKYVGQVWGAAWTIVATCSPHIERYTLPILDASGHRVGSISISAEDATALLTGEVTASDARRAARMYEFE